MISDILLENTYPLYFKILSAKIMKNITSEYAQKFIKESNYFDKLIQLFLTLINININLSQKEIIYIIIQCINNLCIKIDWNESTKTNILSKHIQNICTSIIKLITDLSYYNTQINITRMSFFFLLTLADRSAFDIKEYMI